MLDEGLLSSVLKRTLSRGGTYADIFVEEKKATVIQLEDSKVEKVLSGVDAGIGIRLISGGKTAYAFTNDSSEASLAELADGLSRTSAAAAPCPVLDMKKERSEKLFSVRMPPDTVPVSDKIMLAENADRTARQVAPCIKQVSVSYRDSVQKVQIATSGGRIALDERIHTTAVITVVAAEGNVIQTGYEVAGGHIGFELFEKSSLEELSLRAAQRAVMMLTAKRARGGRMPVVISSEAGGTMIHEAIGHGLEADLAQNGLSVYSGKLGTLIASPLVTVIDDATLPFKRGSYCFDDEGTPSRKTVLVDKGSLIGYLYDNYAALRDGVASTGNGRRQSYQHRPIPRMTNTFVAPGASSPEEVIRSTPNGIFVKKMGGGQVNTVTGDFVFDVQEGYVIENGTLGEPVREATLTGNGPEVLKAIDMVASDLGFSIGTCGKDAQGVPVSDALPTIRISEMVVGGEVS